MDRDAAISAQPQRWLASPPKDRDADMRKGWNALSIHLPTNGRAAQDKSWSGFVSRPHRLSHQGGCPLLSVHEDPQLLGCIAGCRNPPSQSRSPCHGRA